MCIQNPFLGLVHERLNFNAAGVPQRVGDNPIQRGSVGLKKTILKVFSHFAESVKDSQRHSFRKDNTHQKIQWSYSVFILMSGIDLI